MLHYLAYGSNLHHLRLVDRVPSARLVGTVHLPGRRLTFHKRSVDGSGKANLMESDTEGDSAWGAVYELANDEVGALDRAEGLGNGYYKSQLFVSLKDVSYNCFTYQANSSYIDTSLKPYHWYKDFVVIGARFLALPEYYIRMLSHIESIDDPDRARSEKHENYLTQMRAYR